MPSTGIRPEDDLIDLFLSIYENCSWAAPLSTRDLVDRRMDSGVELIATRIADGLTLAIEHTLIEPFVGEKTDFHSRFKALGSALEADPDLKIA
jgi:hypothetical protein